MKPIRPMLAGECNLDKLVFPVYASPKIDGIRSIIRNAVPLSRSLKPIPNIFIQDILGHTMFNGLDGELTVGSPTDFNVMQKTESGVMSRKGCPDFTYWVFDFYTDTKLPFSERLRIMERAEKDGVFAKMNDAIRSTFRSMLEAGTAVGDAVPRVELLRQTLIRDMSELKAYEQIKLEEGYEGVMLRYPQGIYKYGRSTTREGHLLKLKRFVDSEAEIVGFKELMHNANEATVNELQLTERSSRQEGKVPMNTLGALRVVDIHDGRSCDIGTGFTAQQRKEIWDNREQYLGRIVKYKHFLIGAKNAPRIPVWLGFRDERDMS